MPMFIKEGNSLVPVSITIPTSNQGIVIPTITACNLNDGVLSWSVSELDSIHEFTKYDLQYVVHINQFYLTTSDTSIDISAYLSGGNDLIRIEVVLTCTYPIYEFFVEV